MKRLYIGTGRRPCKSEYRNLWTPVLRLPFQCSYGRVYKLISQARMKA